MKEVSSDFTLLFLFEPGIVLWSYGNTSMHWHHKVMQVQRRGAVVCVNK